MQIEINVTTLGIAEVLRVTHLGVSQFTDRHPNSPALANVSILITDDRSLASARCDNIRVLLIGGSWIAGQVNRRDGMIIATLDSLICELVENLVRRQYDLRK